MLSNRDLKDLGYFLISPEDSLAEEHRRMLTNRHVVGRHVVPGAHRPLAENVRRAARRTVRAVERSRAAGVCKTLLWVALSVALTCSLGQLH